MDLLTGLSYTRRAVYEAIEQLLKTRSILQYQDIAAVAECSTKTVQRCVEDLKRLRLIKTMGTGKGEGYEYQLAQSSADPLDELPTKVKQAYRAIEQLAQAGDPFTYGDIAEAAKIYPKAARNAVMELEKRNLIRLSHPPVGRGHIYDLLERQTPHRQRPGFVR